MREYDIIYIMSRATYMRQDLTGKAFGRLTVIKEAERKNPKRHYWLCHCTCGRETVVDGSHLLSGHTKSCGCYHRDCSREKSRDITGMRFGRLTAIRPASLQEGGAGFWKCRCDCGAEVICSKDSLCQGNTRSCGCLQEETRRENMKNAIHFVEGTCVERISSRKNCTNNTRGQRGVYRRENKRWRACIGFKGKVYNLGTFKSYEEAVNARLKAEHEFYDAFLDQYREKTGGCLNTENSQSERKL